MSLPRYPKYKDSGVAWLGEVPIHWDVLSIKRLSPVQRGASPRPIDDQKYFDDGGEYAWVRIADVSASSGVLAESTQKLSALGSSLSVKLNPGELFISIAGTVGKPCITAIKACIHDGFVYFPLLTVAPKFLYRIFEAGQCYAGLGKWGTQLNLNTDTIGSIQIALPPADETRTILEFLDRETAKIDGLIAEQEKLIALLAEKRQATISHAVTKGLNPDVPMKDSEVAWLGEVPAHWEAGNLKRFAEVIDCKHHTVEFLDDGLPIVSIRELRNNRIELTNAKLTSQAEWDFLREGRAPEHGDLVFCRNASVGAVAFVDGTGQPFCMGQDVCLIRPLTKSKYMHYQLTALEITNQIESFLVGATIRRANVEEIRNLFVVLPPAEEQCGIAAFLDSEISRLDDLTAEATRGIALLKERRSALISAAVTGKIDVRAACNQ